MTSSGMAGGGSGTAVFRDRQPIDVLHHDERLAVGSQATIHERDDIRVSQRRQDLALGAEPPNRIGPMEPRRNQLDGDLLGEIAFDPLGAVDLTHPTEANALA